MTVYVLTLEPYHDNSVVLGVFTERELARYAADRDRVSRGKGESILWDIDGSNGYLVVKGACPKERDPYTDDYLITATPLEDW